MFRKQYSTVSDGDANWQHLKFPSGNTYGWEPDSTYIRKAPYFDGMTATPAPIADIRAARALPSSATPSPPTTSPLPAPSRKTAPPANISSTTASPRRLQLLRLPPRQPRSHGPRHLRQRATKEQTRPGTEGGVTRLLPEGTECPSTTPRSNTPSAASPSSSSPAKIRLRQLARLGRQGPQTSGHRSSSPRATNVSTAPTSSAWASSPSSTCPANPPSRSASPAKRSSPSATIPARSSHARQQVRPWPHPAHPRGKSARQDHRVLCHLRIDTPQEILYYQHGGIPTFVLRQLATNPSSPKLVPHVRRLSATVGFLTFIPISTPRAAPLSQHAGALTFAPSNLSLTRNQAMQTGDAELLKQPAQRVSTLES